MKTLIQIQDAALSKLAESRSSELRYLKLKGAVRRGYLREIAKLEITGQLAQATWRDVWDMAVLQREAE